MAQTAPIEHDGSVNALDTVSKGGSAASAAKSWDLLLLEDKIAEYTKRRGPLPEEDNNAGAFYRVVRHLLAVWFWMFIQLVSIEMLMWPIWWERPDKKPPLERGWRFYVWISIVT